MRRARRGAALACVALVLCACGARTAVPAAGTGRPALALAPAAFPESVSLRQQVRVQRGDRDVTLEALLEIDPRRLTLVALGYGQRLFTLRYDGATLDEQRSPFLPSAVQGRDILADMQLALWPAESVRAALPAGWTLVEGSDERVLLHDATPVTTIRFAGAPAWRNVLVLRNHPFAYTLTITPVAER